MSANTSPLFVLTPNSAWVNLTSASAAADGTTGSPTPSLTVTAGVSGARILNITAKALGTNVASVLRVYINNGSATTTAANNILIYEASLPATTASAIAAIAPVVVPPGRFIKPGHKIYVALGTSVAAGWAVYVEAGDY